MGASSTLMKILVALGLDTTEYDKKTKEVEKNSTGIGQRIQTGLSAVGGAAVIGGIAAVGAGVTALTGFLASSIGPASDLEETLSKVGVVFGDNAEKVIAFGQNAAQAMGMTQNDALAAAGTYGNLFRAMGITEGASADMSLGLVQLASDLASFNNMDPTEVLDKLRAGLSGETEPLKSLGVNLNAAMIEAKALELGVWDGVDAIDAAAKAQASYALIMEQTSLAQGDFARTSDGLANSQRILKASFGDLKAKIGTALLPAITTVTQKFTALFSNKQFLAFVDAFITKIGELAAGVMAAIPGVIDWFSNLFTWLGENEGVIVAVLAAIGAAIAVWAYTTLTATLTAAGGFAVLWASIWPVIAVLAAVAAVAYLVYEAWTNNWGGIRDTLTSIWTGTLQPIFQALITWFQTNIPVAIEFLSNLWNTVLLPAIQTAMAWIGDNVVPLFTAIADVLSAVLGVAVTAAAGLWQNILLPALKDVWSFIKESVIPVISDIAGWLGDKLGPAFEGISNAISVVVDWLKDLASAIRNLSLPSWLTPGSPTPFELGLVGIGEAMSDLSHKELPRFGAELDLNPNVPGIGAMSTAGGGAQQTGVDLGFLLTQILLELRGQPRAYGLEMTQALAKADNR